MIDWSSVFAPSPPPKDNKVLVVETFNEALAILTEVFPFAIEPAAMQEYGLHSPGSIQYVAMNAWCEHAYGSKDADEKRFSLSDARRRLYLNRNWCIIKGQFRFKTETDAIAFKLRWG